MGPRSWMQMLRGRRGRTGGNAPGLRPPGTGAALIEHSDTAAVACPAMDRRWSRAWLGIVRAGQLRRLEGASSGTIGERLRERRQAGWTGEVGEIPPAHVADVAAVREEAHASRTEEVERRLGHEPPRRRRLGARGRAGGGGRAPHLGAAQTRRGACRPAGHAEPSPPPRPIAHVRLADHASGLVRGPSTKRRTPVCGAPRWVPHLDEQCERRTTVTVGGHP